MKQTPENLKNLNACYFLIYAMIGWFFELIYCFIVDGEIVNRGLLHGPYLPIYGFGALLVIGVIAPRCKTAIGLFIAAILVCSLLEYFTSWYMETVFKVSLWDYTDFPLNIHGRICLWNSILFGILAMVVIHIFQPFFNHFLKRIPIKIRPLLSVLLVAGLVVDFLFVAFPMLDMAKRAGEVLILFS